MGTTIGDLGLPVAALLIGGLVASLGLTYLARRPRSKAVLARAHGGLVVAVCLGVAGLAGVGAYQIARRSLADLAPDAAGVLAPGPLLVFGLLVGVPLSLPGVLFAWTEARAERRSARRRRDSVPTRDDRRRYASDIARQIEDVSPTPRTVSGSIGGDGGRVLRLEGDIDGAEGERLTAALRADLAELGFKRVEGAHGSREWWSRV